MNNPQPLSKLEQEMIEEKLKELVDYMDDEMYREILIEDGWVEVKFHLHSVQALEIFTWCGKHIRKDKWKRLNDYFMFQEKKDAEWFILRWI